MKPSPDQLQALRLKAGSGASLSLEETRLFILAIRHSYTAAETQKGKAKSRDKVSKGSPVKAENVDFF